MPDPFDIWIAKLFDRWLSELTHQEVARALKVLSRDYVQRRTRLRGKALEGRGKQAAFALYYAPRHFVIVREALKALTTDSPSEIIDLGCGSGVAGAAWALHCGGNVVGVELEPDVLREAAFTFKDLGVRGGGDSSMHFVAALTIRIDRPEGKSTTSPRKASGTTLSI